MVGKGGAWVWRTKVREMDGRKGGGGGVWVWRTKVRAMDSGQRRREGRGGTRVWSKGSG